MDWALTDLIGWQITSIFRHKLYRATCTTDSANSAPLALNLCHCDGAMCGSCSGAQTPKASASGIIYLLKADRPDFPSRDPAKEPCWTNSYVQGVLLRTFWSKIQPREGAIDWSFFDQGVALAAKYNKKLGLLMTAGVRTPRWVYPAGVYEFMVTTERGPRIVKGRLPVGSVLMTACLAVLMTETVSEYS